MGRAASRAPPLSSRPPAPSAPTPRRTEGGKTRAHRETEQGPERWSATQGSRQASAPSRARPQDGAASTARPRQAAAQGLPPRGPHRTARTRDRGRSVRGRPRAPILTGPRASLPSRPAARAAPCSPRRALAVATLARVSILLLSRLVPEGPAGRVPFSRPPRAPLRE